MQFGLFGNPEFENLISKDGELNFYQDFFDENYFDVLNNTTQWRQDQITIYGKTHDIPRLQAWYGDPGMSYRYSGISLNPLSWTKELLEIKEIIETKLGLTFNSCLCNLYRSGQDYAAWHSDDEKELGHNPVIASASFGQSRKMVFKHKFNKGIEKVEFETGTNSLAIMKGELQHFWKHQINKTSKQVGPRINLTFREIKK